MHLVKKLCKVEKWLLSSMNIQTQYKDLHIFCKEDSSVYVAGVLIKNIYLFCANLRYYIGYLWTTWTTIYFHFYTSLHDKWDGSGKGRRKLARKTQKAKWDSREEHVPLENLWNFLWVSSFFLKKMHNFIFIQKLIAVVRWSLFIWAGDTFCAGCNNVMGLVLEIYDV